MYKIVLVDKSSEFGLDFSIQKQIIEQNGMEFCMEDCQTEEEIIEKCSDADAIMVIYKKITPKIIDSLKKCKVILRYGIGYDVIDVESATKNGIMVCNSPNHCIKEVATHTLAMILALCRKIVIYNEKVRNGDWAAKGGYQIHRLSERTLGFVGFGNIARQAAQYAEIFGFSMVAYDPYASEIAFEEFNVRKVSKDELFQKSDIISIHTPLLESTHHIINKESIEKMKDGVMIINTSRGPLVCEKDILEAVKSGKVAAAALDVIESEPITVKNHPLFETGNIIASPHAAYNSVEAEKEMMETLAWTAVKVLKEEYPQNIVNKKQLGL